MCLAPHIMHVPLSIMDTWWGALKGMSGFHFQGCGGPTEPSKTGGGGGGGWGKGHN